MFFLCTENKNKNFKMIYLSDEGTKSTIYKSSLCFEGGVHLNLRKMHLHRLERSLTNATSYRISFLMYT